MRYLVLNHRIVIAVIASKGANRYTLETEKFLNTLREVGTLAQSPSGQMEFGLNLGVSVPRDHFQEEVYVFSPNEDAFLPAKTFQECVIVDVANEVNVVHPFVDKEVIMELLKYGLSVA